MSCTIPELTDREYRVLQEMNLTDHQIAYLSCYRWDLRRRGLAGNVMATPDTLRNRAPQP